MGVRRSADHWARRRHGPAGLGWICVDDLHRCKRGTRQHSRCFRRGAGLDPTDPPLNYPWIRAGQRCSAPVGTRPRPLQRPVAGGWNLPGDSQSKCGWVNSVARARCRFGHRCWRHPRDFSRTPYRGPASPYPAPPSTAIQRSRRTLMTLRVVVHASATASVVACDRSVVDGVAAERTSHAMAAAAAAAEFGADNGNDLDAGFAEQGVGGRVAVVSNHNAGFDGDQVVAAVPLLALGVVDVAAGVDGSQLAQTEGDPNDLQEGLSLVSDLETWRGVARPEGEGVDAV